MAHPSKNAQEVHGRQTAKAVLIPSINEASSLVSHPTDTTADGLTETLSDRINRLSSLTARMSNIAYRILGPEITNTISPEKTRVSSENIPSPPHLFGKIHHCNKELNETLEQLEKTIYYLESNLNL